MLPPLHPSAKHRLGEVVYYPRHSTQCLPRFTDGPQPMKDNRPVEKILNSADQFWQEHGAGFSYLGKSEDKMREVNEHHNTHPKMEGELNKRRDIAKPTLPTTTENTYLDPNCRFCRKMMAEMRRNRSKDRKYRYDRRPHRKAKSRVTKSKRRRRRITTSEFRLNRKHSDSDLNEENATTSQRARDNARRNQTSKDSKTNISMASNDSNDGTVSPGSLRSSSSSLDKEPMVEK